MTLFSFLFSLLLVLLLAFHARRWQRTQAPPHPSPPLHPAAPSYPDDPPAVSFLVPAWNAAADLPGFVNAYRALNYPRKELLLCVGGADGGLALARGYEGADVRVLEQLPGEGKQRALAKLFALSRGAVIFLTDIDCRPDAAGVWRLVEPLAGGRESVVTGGSAPLEAQRGVGAVLVHWAVERRAAPAQPRPVDGLLGRNCAVTRSALEAVDGFRFDAPTGTDYRLAQRLQARGHRIWFEPGSEVRTTFAWPLGVYVRKQGRWLRNVVLYAERPRQRAEFRGALVALAAPYGFLLLFALSLALRTPWPGAAALLLLLHGVLNRFHYVRETLSPRHLGAAVVPGSVLNLLATLAAGLYASVTLLTPALRKQW